jgi:gamma-glutamyltranspeptidase/glutathione hydrolase
MSSVAVAASSQIAADAGARVAAEGGNAADAAIASMLVALTTEPGICALGGGGFVTVWPSQGEPVTIDGYVEMPGRGLPPEQFGQGGRRVHLTYGGGVETTVGHGSVGTPGALAALGEASRRFGRVPWKMLVEPAREWARDGFPLPDASHQYLRHSGEVIYGWHPQSFAALHDESGRLREAGETIRVDHLAESLEVIGHEGVEVFYRGELGKMISDHIVGGGGVLTRRDMARYEAILRAPLEVDVDEWCLATNPPPAIGGGALTAMLLLMEGRPRSGWSPEEIENLIRVQHAVLDYRRAHIDRSTDLADRVMRLVEDATQGELRRHLRSPSTVQVSSVDSGGLACSLSISTGYGSGVMPPGTGIWMNNCLGELELNRRGYHSWPPGSRLASNMAPSVARSTRGAVLAFGSPGADRIPTAIQQTFINFAHLGMTLEEAIGSPRLHVELLDDGYRVAYEAGLPVDALDVPQRRFDGRSMYFGGVAATLWDPRGGFSLGSDPRRTGGTARYPAS